jgi:hypothetical protein
MPEQVKRPNPWRRRRRMMMKMILWGKVDGYTPGLFRLLKHPPEREVPSPNAQVSHYNLRNQTL